MLSPAVRDRYGQKEHQQKLSFICPRPRTVISAQGRELCPRVPVCRRWKLSGAVAGGLWCGALTRPCPASETPSHERYGFAPCGEAGRPWFRVAVSEQPFWWCVGFGSRGYRGGLGEKVCWLSPPRRSKYRFVALCNQEQIV